MAFRSAALHLRGGVTEGAVEHGVGLVVQLQDGPVQSHFGPGADDLAVPALAFHRGQPLVAGRIQVAGPVRHPVPEPIGGQCDGPAEDLVGLVEEVVAMGAVGVISQDPGVIEPDPALRPRHPGVGQRRQLAGHVASGAGGGAGDTGVLAQPGCGVPEVIPAPRPQAFDLHEQLDLFGIESVAAGLEAFGPLAQDGGVLGKQGLVRAGSGRCLEHVYVTLDGLDARCNTWPDFFSPLRPPVGARSPGPSTGQ